MTKLTNIFAVCAPPRGGGAFAVAPSFYDAHSGGANTHAERGGLVCRWAKDAAGRLVCRWTDVDDAEPAALDPTITKPSSSRRGVRRVGSAAARLAA